MRWLLDLRLKYKFWLVNGVSFAIAMALILCAMNIYTQGVQERDAVNAKARLEVLVPVIQAMPREQVLDSIRGDWFAIDAQSSRTTGQAALDVKQDLLKAMHSQRASDIRLILQAPEFFESETPAFWISSVFVEELQLVLGVRVATTTLFQTFLAQAPIYAVVSGVLMTLLLLVSQTLISFIERHVNRLRDVMLRVQKESDLTLRVTIDCKDEVGEMAQAFNLMQQSYQDAVSNIRDSASKLSGEVVNLTRAAGDTNQQMERQQMETDQVVTAMHQMSGAAQEVARNAAGTHEVSESATAKALAGDASVQQTRTAILKLSEEILAASRLIEQLNENSQRIESATSQIQNISDQTNLLALNAAIEAARAGTVGRGFAVVADEVRNLAMHAHQASGAINQVVESIRQVTEKVTGTMESSRAMANQCVEKAEDAAVVLREINQVVERIKDNNLMIATAAEEQSQASETISEGLKAIREDTLRTAANANAVSSSGEEIRHQAERLIMLVQSMKI